jgi:hypothetical protein
MSTLPCSGKQRMLNAYRGIRGDRAPVAPEFWYYYPAKVLGVDMIEFSRSVPFHLALKTTFERFACEGWGATFAGGAVPDVTWHTRERWLDAERQQLRIERRVQTPFGTLTCAELLDRDEPGWTVERLVKDAARDLDAFVHLSLGGDPAAFDAAAMTRAWTEVGESYLLEGWVGVPFFDWYGGGREGGFEAAVCDLFDPGLQPRLRELQARYAEHLTRRAEAICRQTPLESLVIGCTWSCNSLLGPVLWREWDKPVIRAVAEAVHRCGRLLHLHFHGRCLETVADFAELGIDCVCPFERPPGGDVAGAEGLREVARRLAGRVTMNGNIHTVETLIRGTPAAVRSEVQEVYAAFGHTPRVIVGTGDQVGRETPEANLHALVDEARRLFVYR